MRNVKEFVRSMSWVIGLLVVLVCTVMSCFVGWYVFVFNLMIFIVTLVFVKKMLGGLRIIVFRYDNADEVYDFIEVGSKKEMWAGAWHLGTDCNGKPYVVYDMFYVDKTIGEMYVYNIMSFGGWLVFWTLDGNKAAEVMKNNLSDLLNKILEVIVL